MPTKREKEILEKAIEIQMNSYDFILQFAKERQRKRREESYPKNIVKDYGHEKGEGWVTFSKEYPKGHKKDCKILVAEAV